MQFSSWFVVNISINLGLQQIFQLLVPSAHYINCVHSPKPEMVNNKIVSQ